MSQTRLKIAADVAGISSEAWELFMRALIAEAGNEALWIPGTYTDPELQARQGNLFEDAAKQGLSERGIAKRFGVTRDMVRRRLGRRCNVSAPAA